MVARTLGVFFPAFVVLAACHSSSTPAPPAASTSPTESPPVGDAGVALLDAANYETPIATIPVAIVDAGSAPEDMLRVPGGTFTMGADTGGEGDERPAHDVTLGAFWLDRTEVTQVAYDACVAAKVCTAPDPEILNIFGGLFKAPKKPVIGISWHSARQYCEWRGKRLPREAEFERAVRGDDGRRYPWGNDAPAGGDDDEKNPKQDPHFNHAYAYNWPQTRSNDLDAAVHVSPPGRFPFGNNENGVADLAGDLLPYVWDVDKKGKVLQTGFVWTFSWETHGLWWNTTTWGIDQNPDEPNGYYAIGLRCVRD